MKKAYSVNDEEFNFDEPGGALQALADDGLLTEGGIYYEIDVEDIDLSHYLHSHRILEFAAESIGDEVGEAAEDAFQASQAAHDELNAFTKAWCEKHFAGERYWRCKGRSREVYVTADDIASMAP
jgi:hypothetical protein